MMGKRKHFDRELYNKNDKLAKECTRAIIKKHKNFKVEENEKKRGVDLLLYYKGKHVANIECEIKRVWKTKKFFYPSIQIPERKEKFTGLDKPTIFIVFNNDQSSYMAIEEKNLLASPKKEVPNRFVYKGEYFFQVPRRKAVQDSMKSILKRLEKKNGK